jgi:hypothetical protein
MQRDATAPTPRAILAQCIRECAAAPSGHGRRWAVARADRALAALGASAQPSTIDIACTQAARRLGEWLAAR